MSIQANQGNQGKRIGAQSIALRVPAPVRSPGFSRSPAPETHHSNCMNSRQSRQSRQRKNLACRGRARHSVRAGVANQKDFAGGTAMNNPAYPVGRRRAEGARPTLPAPFAYSAYFAVPPRAETRCPANQGNQAIQGRRACPALKPEPLTLKPSRHWMFAIRGSGRRAFGAEVGLDRAKAGMFKWNSA